VDHSIYNSATNFLYLNDQTGPNLKLHFILILPALARKAISGSATQMDTLSQLVQKVCKSTVLLKLQVSPWSYTRLKSSKLSEQILAAILHQFISTEWDAHDSKGHLRLPFCVSTIKYLMKVGQHRFDQKIQTRDYFLEIYNVFWLLLKWHTRLSSNPTFTASDEDKEQVRKAIETFFGPRELPCYEDGDTVWDFHHFTSQVSLKRVLALPHWLWNTRSFKILKPQDMDGLFCHFFRINAHHANPEFPATEEDRSSTLKALVQSVSDRPLWWWQDSSDWELLLTSWRDKLVSETIGSGYADMLEAEDGETSQSEVSSVNASANMNKCVPKGTVESNPPDSPAKRACVSDLLDIINRSLHEANLKASKLAISADEPHNHSPPPGPSSALAPEPDVTPNEYLIAHQMTSLHEYPALTFEAWLGDNESNTSDGRGAALDGNVEQGDPPATTIGLAPEACSQSSAPP
jgi:hypothetical protein